MTRTRGNARRPAALSALLALPLAALVAGLVPAASTAAPVAGAAVDLASAPLPYSFTTTGWAIADIPTGLRPYEGRGVPSLVDSRPHDSHGVRMVVIGGRSYNHPVGQASLALSMLNGYRITHDRRYLTIALANASRIVSSRKVDTSVVATGAWFYANNYPFALHRIPADRLPTPWYSAMAQGEALSLFSRLAVVTGAREWRVAADRTFASFLVPRRATGPWVTNRDADGHLWLEEFASPTGRPAPDHTFNGHNFAAVGLYDYFALTGDGRARTLLDGAMTSSLARLPLLRQPGWKSHYCLRHPQVTSAGYHRIHIQQMLWFFRMTGDTSFARWADRLEADYPTPAMHARLWLSAGTHVGRRMTDSGAVTGTVTLRTTRASLVTMDQRKRFVRSGQIWYLVASGSLAGTWVPEKPGTAQVYGAVVRLSYPVVRTFAMPASPSTVSVVRLASSGAVLDSGTITAQTAPTFSFDARGIVNGVDRLRISAGPWAGWWILASKVTVDPT